MLRRIKKNDVRKTILFILFVIPLVSFAQKKLEPVTQTAMLSIPLPPGSKKDSRGISVSAAKALLSTESKKAGVSVNNTEVYSLPVGSFSNEMMRQALSVSGFVYSPLPSDPKMGLVSGNGKTFMIYFSEESYGTELYIGECSAVPLAQQTPVPPMPPMPDTPQPPMPPMPPMPSGQPVQTTEIGVATMPVVPQSPLPSGFQFNTSNFNDGWNSFIQENWILVEKGNARVYLYYVLPYNSDNFSGTGVMERDYYWDNYVTKQFNVTGKSYNDAGEFVSSLKPKYVEGSGTDLRTGETRYIAMTLAIAPNAAMVTVASFPDEQSFRQQFPRANDKYSSDLMSMSRYNKFAIGANDLLGTWQSGGTQMTQWYDAITGAYAGATMASSSATFQFLGNGSYNSTHNGATGAIGAMNTFQQEYKGSYTVTNWNVTATNRYEGRTDNFDAHFQAVRGGRLLYMNDKRGGEYTLVRIR
jgi:hypothetical protein